MFKIRRFLPFILVSMALCSFTGCAATQVALEHKDLDVQVKMSETIFLDISNGFGKSIFVDVRNTSDYDIHLREMIESELIQKGYTITRDPRESYYLLQANILYIGKDDPSALQSSLSAGYGGEIAEGLLAGAAMGYLANQRASGMAVGGLVGAGASVVANSLVKDVTYSMMIDLQISEKSEAEIDRTFESNVGQGTSTQVKQVAKSKENFMRYKTRILSTANKVNLDFAEAQPALETKLSKSISGIF